MTAQISVNTKIFTMKQSKHHDKTNVVGPKTKACLLITWAHLLAMTWLILNKQTSHVWLQATCLLLTIVVFYLQVVLIQDYYFIKFRHRCLKCSKYRHDVRLLEPLKLKRNKRK